jgi:NAD+ kinase
MLAEKYSVHFIAPLANAWGNPIAYSFRPKRKQFLCAFDLAVIAFIRNIGLGEIIARWRQLRPAALRSNVKRRPMGEAYSDSSVEAMSSVDSNPVLAIVNSDTEEAQSAGNRLRSRYGDASPEMADIVVALGGDGLMLSTLHRLMGTGKPIYGMNRGSVGFLMNEYAEDGLIERLKMAERSVVHPLLMHVIDHEGLHYDAHAINEVSVFRQSYQAAKLKISIDGRPRLDELVADGILVSTPAGSTAYNLSANGPILPLNAPMLALTPISPFRPRRWRGAILPDTATITLDALETDKRPVNAVADHVEFRSVKQIRVSIDRTLDLVMLHDPGHSLDERILREQFGA